MVVSLSLVFFFFKQKTAYEMRISDWSSDVCSSDLKALAVARANGTFDSMEALARRAELPGRALRSLADADACRSIGVDRREALWEARRMPDDVLPLFRSEEHTSELQSLMRNSYAVFCLKKKTHNTQKSTKRICQNEYYTTLRRLR